MNRPVYVTRLDVANNTVIIGDDGDLFKSSFRAGKVNWISQSPPDGIQPALAQIRYRHQAAPGAFHVLPTGDVEFTFDEPQRAITPGQSVVFYDLDNELALAGGVVDDVF